MIYIYIYIYIEDAMRRATAAPPEYCTLVQKMEMFMQGIFRSEGVIVVILFWKESALICSGPFRVL